MVVLIGVMALRGVTVHLVMGTLTPLEERPRCHRGFQAPWESGSSSLRPLHATRAADPLVSDAL